MEGVRESFDQVLDDLSKRLQHAEFVAIDTELTGINIDSEQDTFEEPPSVRLDRLCRVAETYCLIQLGITVVTQGPRCTWSCMSYNVFAFPHAGPELLGRSPNFMCQAMALKFNAQHHVDFNRWIYDGVPYMTREDEQRYLATEAGRADADLEQKVGLLRLWKLLCRSGLPFVVHCPSDLFFLLAAFECNPLPRDPRQLAQLIRRCTPKVFDTAHLHGLVGRFRRLGLTKFYEDAKARYEKSLKEGSATPVDFTLTAETSHYGNPSGEQTHQAGYDSLITAKLFMYLRSIAPMKVTEGGNHLFLYHSVEYIDLDKALQGGEVGCSLFDHSRVTLLVAAVLPGDLQAVARRMTSAEYLCKIMDLVHVLVVLRASGGAAVRKAMELARSVPEVQQWMPFETWRDKQTSKRLRMAKGSNGEVPKVNGHAVMGIEEETLNGHGSTLPSVVADVTASASSASAPAMVVPIPANDSGEVDATATGTHVCNHHSHQAELQGSQWQGRRVVQLSLAGCLILVASLAWQGRKWHRS
mmetsp:Transcript_14347/g.26367  ORF Transcript_14347/g.26367 Transcript_14347/m.26367 type:complete len:527 (+) Transcript_14347:153-1733(+)